MPATRGGAGHRRRGSALRDHHQSAGRHRGRMGAGTSRRRAAPRHRVPPVPPDRAQAPGRQSGAAHLRGGAWRGRRPGRPRRAPASRWTPIPGASWRRGTSSPARSRWPMPTGGAWLDAREIDDFPTRFPGITAILARHGLDAAARPPAGRARAPLRDGRRPDRPRGPLHAAGPLGGGRGRLDRRARRQPARVQLAARGSGLRRPRGPRAGRRDGGRGRRRRSPLPDGADPAGDRRRRGVRGDPAETMRRADDGERRAYSGPRRRCSTPSRSWRDSRGRRRPTPGAPAISCSSPRSSPRPRAGAGRAAAGTAGSTIRPRPPPGDGVILRTPPDERAAAAAQARASRHRADRPRRRSRSRRSSGRSAGSPGSATRWCWRTTTSGPRSRTSPTTSATRSASPGRRPRRRRA